MGITRLFGGAAILLVAGSLAHAQDLGDGLRWRALGPFRGGWATAVEGVPSKPDTFYFGAAGGGVWKTQDAGRTWQPIFEHGPAAAIGALAVSPSDPNVIYVGTGQPEPRYDIGAGLGIFKSRDGGRSWTSLGLGDTRYVGRIWVDPKNPDIVLVGAQGHFFGPSDARGLYRSQDGGRSWTRTLAINPWTGVVDIAADPKNPKTIFAAAWEAHQYPWLSYFTKIAGPGSAVYKSSDEGRTWKMLSGGGWPGGPLGRIGLAVAHTPKGVRVYAAVDANEKSGLYRSDDGGLHWKRVNDTDAFSDWYASRLTVAPNDSDTVYAVGQSIRRCDQGGARCEIVKGAPGGDDYHHIWINPLHPDHLITGSDQGAVVSVDGGATWSSWYNQPTGQFYHLETDNRFPYWIYSGQQDSGTVAIASRSDYGALSLRDWHPVGGDERDYDVPDPADPQIVYGSGLGGHVSRWDGRTGQVTDITPWPEKNYGVRPTLTKYRYLWMTPLVPSKSGAPALYLGGNVLFRSRDRGAHWSVISGDLTGKIEGAMACDGEVTREEAKACGYGTISAIAPSPRHADEIWVGTDDGLVQLTRDGGAHWSEITPPPIPLWAKVASLDISAQDDGVAYAAVDGHRIDDFQPHVWRTRDYGKTWQAIDADLPRDHFVDVVRADPVQPGLLYAGSDAGVFVSLDDGAHWQALARNLPTAWVTDLLVHGDDLVAATEGRGIFVLDDVAPLRELAAGNTGESTHLFAPAMAYRVHPDNNRDTPPPPETALGENPPAGAIIDYRLAADVKGPVTLTIRDAAGAVVRRFASDEPIHKLAAERYFAKGWDAPALRPSAAPGLHRLVWDLHWTRPQSAKYSYSIAAVWGRGTPILPEGPLAVPGKYQIVLEAGGQRITQSLTLIEDPRVSVSQADLEASLEFSHSLDTALADAGQGWREEASLMKLLDKRFPWPPRDPALEATLASLRDKPPEGAATFSSVASALAQMESEVEGADAAPSDAQRAYAKVLFDQLATLKTRWAAKKLVGLAALNTTLYGQGLPPVLLDDALKLKLDAPEDGEDLP